jgi:hypothetical protein
MFIETFTRHPASVGETYAKHFGRAWGFGWTMVVAGLACAVHAFFPFLFEHTASRCVQRLHAEMARRNGLRLS